RSAMPNWLASPASETDVSCGYEPPCQSDQLVFRRRFTDHSPGYSAALWRKEIARARTRNGSGDQRIPEGEGRIYGRVAQGRSKRHDGEGKSATGIDCSQNRRSRSWCSSARSEPGRYSWRPNQTGLNGGSSSP